MTQKIIQIGSSAGIIIPKKQLEELGLNVGDKVTYKLKPAEDKNQAELVKEYDEFVAQYGETLKNLANR